MPPVSDAELEVLKVLWSAGPSTVRDVAAALWRQKRRLAYNTVLTLLSRLREKGFVDADRRDTAHVFRAVVMIHPGGLGGRPLDGHRCKAAANASCTASSARSMSPKARVRTATARPYSRRKICSTSSVDTVIRKASAMPSPTAPSSTASASVVSSSQATTACNRNHSAAMRRACMASPTATRAYRSAKTAT